MNVYVFYRYMVGKLDRVGRRLDAILGHVMCSHISENWMDVSSMCVQGLISIGDVLQQQLSRN